MTAAYKIITKEWVNVKKHNMSPEIVFIGFNIIFVFIVLNNFYWFFKT
jgi:hypothetical protein